MLEMIILCLQKQILLGSEPASNEHPALSCQVAESTTLEFCRIHFKAQHSVKLRNSQWEPVRAIYIRSKISSLLYGKKKCKKCFLVFGITNRRKAYLLFYSESWEEMINNLFQWFWRCGTGLRQDSSAQFYNEPSENWQNVGEGTVRWLSG